MSGLLHNPIGITRHSCLPKGAQQCKAALNLNPSKWDSIPCLSSAWLPAEILPDSAACLGNHEQGAASAASFCWVLKIWCELHQSVFLGNDGGWWCPLWVADLCQWTCCSCHFAFLLDRLEFLTDSLVHWFLNKCYTHFLGLGLLVATLDFLLQVLFLHFPILLEPPLPLRHLALALSVLHSSALSLPCPWNTQCFDSEMLLSLLVFLLLLL